VIPQLEAVVALYRAENGRARAVDTQQIRAFRAPLTLTFDFSDENAHNGNGAGGASGHGDAHGQPNWMGNGNGDNHGQGGSLILHAPEEYEKVRMALVTRYEELRARFNEEARK
jgi:hypothetical protein